MCCNNRGIFVRFKPFAWVHGLNGPPCLPLLYHIMEYSIEMCELLFATDLLWFFNTEDKKWAPPSVEIYFYVSTLWRVIFFSYYIKKNCFSLFANGLKVWCELCENTYCMILFFFFFSSFSKDNIVITIRTTIKV